MNQKSKIETQPDAATSKGQASRSTILSTAARLATTKGLDGLSIGDLAAEVGMSKSGLYAHFKSKEELELATIDAAGEIFDREVVSQAIAAPAGLQRLRTLVDSFISHLERHVFPGGCFFASVAMELDTRPGRARDRVLDVLKMWGSLQKQCYLDAVELGELPSGFDVDQAVFETSAMMFTANFQFVMTTQASVLQQARQGLDHIIERLTEHRAGSKQKAGSASRKKK